MQASAIPAKGTAWTMVLCFIVSALEGYDLQVISSAGPHLQRVMHLTPAQIGIFFSATLVGLAVGAVVGGRLSDRFGRKPALVWSVAALGLFTLLTALATSFEAVLALRILAGVGLGGAMPTLIALIAEISGGRKTTAAVTTIICGQPTGGIVSALVGKTVAEHFGWQSLFLVGGILTLAVVPLLMKSLPETGGKSAHGALGGGPRMNLSKALFGEGRTTGTVLLWLLFILTLALMSILLSWTPLLVMAKGLPRPVGLNAIIAVNLGGIVGGIVISRMIDRFGMRWPMLSLYVLMALGLYLFAQTQGAGPLMALAFVVGFGVLGAQFSLYGIAPQMYPAQGRGGAVGVAVAMGRIGSILGPIVVGGFLAAGSSGNQAVSVMAPIALASGLVLLALTVTARLHATGGTES